MKGRSSGFNSAYGDHITATYVNDNKVVVAYRGYTERNGGEGCAVLGFVEENNVFFNKPILLHDSNIYYPAVVYDSLNDKVVVVYRDDFNGYGVVRVGTINNNDIVFNDPVIFSKNNVHYITAMYDKVSGKVIIGYLEDDNRPTGIVKIGTISGDNIMFSDSVVFSDNLIYSISMTYDNDNNKVILTYCDYNNKSSGVIKVGNLVDNSIVFGNEVVFSDSNTYDTSVVYDHMNKKVIITYIFNNGEGMVKVGTVSDNIIVLSEPVAFSKHKTKHMSTLYDHINNKVLIAYRNYDDSNIEDYTEEDCYYYDKDTDRRYDYKTDTVSGRVVAGTVTEDNIFFNKPVIFSETSVCGISLMSDHNNKTVVVYHDGHNGYGTAKVI